MTVSGLNFGALDFTTSFFLSTAVCKTATWTSSTSAVCHTPSYSSTDRFLPVTVGAAVGTMVPGYTFDVASVSTGPLNIVLSGSQLLTVSGLNFGAWDFTS